MKKTLTHPIIVYIVSFNIILAYAICFKSFNAEWLWGIALFAIPVMIPTSFILEAISTLFED